MEIESLKERSSHAFEDESLISPEKIGQNSHSFHESQLGSSYGEWRIWGSNHLGSAVFMSIRIVVFSNKLNFLMPFGPLAVLIHILTDHNVSFMYILLPSPWIYGMKLRVALLICYGDLQGWVFFLTLLGITPLAERLGYATE